MRVSLSHPGSSTAESNSFQRSAVVLRTESKSQCGTSERLRDAPSADDAETDALASRVSPSFSPKSKIHLSARSPAGRGRRVAETKGLSKTALNRTFLSSQHFLRTRPEKDRESDPAEVSESTTVRFTCILRTLFHWASTKSLKPPLPAVKR